MAGLLPDAGVAVAVMGLSTQLSLLPWMFCYSLGTATATRVAQALGGGSALRASRILRWAGFGCRRQKAQASKVPEAAAVRPVYGICRNKENLWLSRQQHCDCCVDLAFALFCLQDGMHAGSGVFSVPVRWSVAAESTNDGSTHT
jgi:hypothetical protein